MSYHSVKPNSLKRTLQLAKHVGYRPIVNPLYMHYIKSKTNYTHVLCRAINNRYRIILIDASFYDGHHICVFESNVKMPVHFSESAASMFGRYYYFEIPRAAIDFRKGFKVPFLSSRAFSSFKYLKELIFNRKFI